MLQSKPVVKNVSKVYLIIDCGNSYCKVGVFQTGEKTSTTPFPTVTKKYGLQFVSRKSKTKQQLTKLLQKCGRFPITNIIFGSVLKQTTNQVWYAVLQKLWPNLPIYQINANTTFPFALPNNLQPVAFAKIGHDLLALATYCTVVKTTPYMVGISYGTAIAAVLISADNALAGINFFAGLDISSQALFNQAQLLKKFTFPKGEPLGFAMDNVHCLAAGYFHAGRGYALSIANYYEQQYGLANISFVLTGGNAFALHTNQINYQLDADAIFLGYYWIYCHNMVTNQK